LPPVNKRLFDREKAIWYFSMAKPIRSFIAVALPPSIVDYIDNIKETLCSYRFNVRWVKPETIHLTLKFLGDINATDIGVVGAAMDRAVKETAPITLSVRGAGVFPGVKRPRVVWLGMGGQVPVLIALQQALDENLAAAGFEKEKRPFRAHLTLGRVKGAIDAAMLGKALSDMMNVESMPFVVDRIFLIKSELKPSGPVYTKLINTLLMTG
jgi:2'-5' RNA ligase